MLWRMLRDGSDSVFWRGADGIECRNGHGVDDNRNSDFVQQVFWPTHGLAETAWQKLCGIARINHMSWHWDFVSFLMFESKQLNLHVLVGWQSSLLAVLVVVWAGSLRRFTQVFIGWFEKPMAGRQEGMISECDHFTWCFVQHPNPDPLKREPNCLGQVGRNYNYHDNATHVYLISSRACKW